MQEKDRKLPLYCIPQGCTGVLSGDKEGALMTHGITTCVGVLLMDDKGHISLSHADAQNYSADFFKKTLAVFSNPSTITIRLFGTAGHPVFKAFIDLAEKSEKKELKTYVFTKGKDGVFQDAVMVKKVRNPDGTFGITQSKFIGGSFLESEELAQYNVQYGPYKADTDEEYFMGTRARVMNSLLSGGDCSPLHTILINAGIWGKPVALLPDVSANLGKDWKTVE